MKESRERREEDRLKIIKRISDKRRPDDIQAELEKCTARSCEAVVDSKLGGRALA